MNLLQRTSRWVDTEYEDCKLGLPFTRLLYAFFSLMGMPDFQWLSGFPDSFFFPPLGVAMFFESFPDPGFFWALGAAQTFLLVLVLFGLFTRSASILLGVCGVVGSAFAYSLGKIDHSILGVLIPFVGGLSGWGARLSIDSILSKTPLRSTSRPLCIFAVVISFTMLTAAIPKAETGWLSLQSQSVLGHLIYNYHVVDRQTWLSGLMFSVENRWFWEAQDWITVLFEAGFILFVWNLRSFRFFCALAVVFHLAVHFSMDIFFGANLMAYALFVPWHRMLPARWSARFIGDGGASSEKPRVWLTRGLGVVTMGVFFVWCTMTVGNPIRIVLGHLGVSTGDFALFLLTAAPVMVSVWGFLRLVGVLTGRGSFSGGAPVVLFDGVCGLCNKWVDFILKIDRRGMVRFASLQSETGTRLLREHGLKEGYLDSIVLVEDGRALTKSDAVLEVMRATRTRWSVLNLFSVLPRYFRDAVYDLIAANRYRIFGKHDTCRLPSPEERARFVDL